MARYSYDFYPSWFGGAEETDKAIVELAEMTANALKAEVGDIVVNRESNPWIATIEFLRPAS